MTLQLSLVDFGATREYKKEFMDNWLRLLQAAASEDRTACAEVSRNLGYLTGEENEVRLCPTRHRRPTHLLTQQCTGHAQCSHRLDSASGDPFQTRDDSAFCIWTWNAMGRHHSSNTSYPTPDAQAQIDSPAKGNIQSKSVSDGIYFFFEEGKPNFYFECFAYFFHISLTFSSTGN